MPEPVWAGWARLPSTGVGGWVFLCRSGMDPRRKVGFLRAVRFASPKASLCSVVFRAKRLLGGHCYEQGRGYT